MNEVQDLIQETEESLIDYLPKLGTACALVVEEQQTGQDWLDLFQSILDGIKWVAEAIDGIRKVDSTVLQDADLERVITLLNEVQAAMSSQDFVLFGDLMQYELKELLESFHQLVVKELEKHAS